MFHFLACFIISRTFQLWVVRAAVVTAAFLPLDIFASVCVARMCRLYCRVDDIAPTSLPLFDPLSLSLTSFSLTETTVKHELSVLLPYRTLHRHLFSLQTGNYSLRRPDEALGVSPLSLSLFISLSFPL